ncbi:MAG: hypothetical protein J0M24_13755 [Verrucomicrobia bacterium]|nr:hypothetical protein [Verrucomicrobiota bacterium]
MLTYRQALLVAVDEPVKSRHLASLAAAANDRLAGGAGDGCRRVIYYWFGGLFRQIRNPDASFLLYPAQAEFHQFYQMLEPTDAQWPVSGPGDPEGTNVANPIVAYLQGAEAIDLESERVRLASVPVGFDDDQPLTPWRQWLLGSAQRGAFDPYSGVVGSPAFTVARAYTWVRSALTSPHGNAAGGYLPGPDVTGPCSTEPFIDYVIKFTNRKTGEVRTYGTCPENPGDLAGIGYGPVFYFLVFYSGATVLLPVNQWFEGKYTGNPRLSKTQSGALGRVLNAFAADFRGTEEQRAAGWMDDAFALQEFCTRQYALAPQLGQQIGEGAVLAIYPSWETSADYLAPATVLSPVNGDPTVRPGTKCHGWAATADGLQRACRVQLLLDGDVKGEFTLEPTDGHAEAIQIFEAALGPGVLAVRLPDGLESDPAGNLVVEASTLLDYQPNIHDWAFVTRLASYNAAFDRPDGLGTQVTAARQISDGLFDSGCVIPIVEASAFGAAGLDVPINQNAVFDAARRFSQHARIVSRWQLAGYEVAGGKSILYFDRFALGSGRDTPIDLFKNIGPNPNPIESGQIVWGRRYRVKSGRATYNAVDYLTGQEFIGLEGITEYQGGGDVREVNGIRQTAEPQGFSNRWLLDLTLKPFHPSSSSVWKPEAYADQVTPFVDRCHVYGPEIVVDGPLKAHITFGENVAQIPEASLTALRYAKIGPNVYGYTHANRRNCAEDDDACLAEKAAFYRSCRIGEPPVEIEKAEEVEFGGRTVVKLTLTGRLHHDEVNAPATISADPGDWDLTALKEDETYRTAENGIREYLVYQNGLGAPSFKVGDWALNSGLEFETDAPLASVMPTVFLVQLIPEPYRDDNDDQDASDSPIYHDQLRHFELVLRAMCEGYVDGVTSAEQACEYGIADAYDFNEANLHYAASGNRWIPWQPESLRPDNPQGFGPVPNTDLNAALYNHLARAVNLLTDVRIMLPAQFEGRSHQGVATGAISAVDECGTPVTCPGHVSGSYFAAGRTGLSASPTTTGSWTPLDDSGGANAGYFLDGGSTSGAACTGDLWKVTAEYNEQEFRWVLTDPESQYAIPPSFRSYLETDGVAAMSVDYSVDSAEVVYLAAPASGDPVASVGLCNSVYAWYEITTRTWSECTLARRWIRPPAVPAGAVVTARVTGGGPGTETGAGGSSGASAQIYQNGTALIRIPTVPYEE